MTLQDIAHYRLVAQHIAQPDFEAPEEVVRHLLAMQAQDYPGGLWSIGLRMKEPNLKAVEKAIADRKIVRTWPMRGTLHFMHADDVRWMVELLAPRVTQLTKGRRLNLGLTDKVMDEAEVILRAELNGDKVLRRDALQKLLAERVKGIDIGSQQFGHILRNFGERGIICFGPHEGKQPTFVLLDNWLPKTTAKDREVALGELAKRYFVSHGPATLQDFAGWGYLTMGDARKALELARTELESLVVSDTTYYLGRNLKPTEGSSLYLLPGFDEYMLGYKGRSAVLPTEYGPKIIPGNNGMFLSTVVLDGQVVGTWKRNIRKTGVIITPCLFVKSTKLSERELGVAVGRYGEFLDTPVTLA